MYQYVHTVRSIYVDSPHPKGPINWWMGDSRAHWDRDTLVIDVMHFTDQTHFDRVERAAAGLRVLRVSRKR